MKLLKNLLPLLSLALVPALASAAPLVPSDAALARLAEREAVALRLEGLWTLDLVRTEELVSAKKLTAPKLEFRRDPLVVLLARTADARMAALPMFDGGLVNDGHGILPYILVDRGESIELMVFHPGEGTSFAWADVLAVHLVATADGVRLFLGGTDPRSADGVYGPAPVPAPIVVRIERAPLARQISISGN